MANTKTNENICLSEVVEEMFMVLSTKEKDVIVKRFSLDNQPRRTLESIGQHFSVTRERIRQIEKIALGKLRRTFQTTRLNLINELASKIMTDNGGLLLESKLVSEILNIIKSDDQVDAHIIKLGLNINQNLEKIDKSNLNKPYWKFKEVDISTIDLIIKTGIKVLKKKEDVMSDAKLVSQIRQLLADKLAGCTDPLLISSLEVDNRTKRTENGFGLMSWRHINPRSIRDKAYIILKEEEKTSPLC